MLNTIMTTIMSGLARGSMYAIVALGYTMVYGIIRLINFAHGDFIMVGGYSLFFAIPVMLSLGLPSWLAVVVAIIVCSVLGMLVEFIAYRPVRKTGNKMTALITAIAMSLFLENLAQWIPAIGPNNKNIIVFTEISTIKVKDSNGKLLFIVDPKVFIAVLLGIVVMIGLTLFVNKTKTGRAMRAVSEDKEAAITCGININKIITITFAIGAGLAAVAALIYTSQYISVKPVTGSSLGLFAFVSAVLGGIGSIPGAMVGGLAIGMIYQVAFTIPQTSRIADAFVFLVLIIMLLLKPSGLLGHNTKEKV